jgi:hypothetical protein
MITARSGGAPSDAARYVTGITLPVDAGNALKG